MAVFGVLWEIWQILINLVNLDQFRYKNNSFFFDFEKVDKIAGNLVNFLKKFAGHKTSNLTNFQIFVLEMQ